METPETNATTVTAVETKPAASAADTVHNPGQPTASREVATLQEGAPPIAGRAGGPSGRSKYQPIFDQVKNILPGKGWVKVPTSPENHDKDLAHVRTALKRQGLFNPDVVKVSTLGGSNKTALCIFIPEDADIEARDLEAPAK